MAYICRHEVAVIDLEEYEELRKRKALTKGEINIIHKALVEYEKNHYMDYDEYWQDVINSLIGYMSK